MYSTCSTMLYLSCAAKTSLTPSRILSDHEYPLWYELRKRTLRRLSCWAQAVETQNTVTSRNSINTAVAQTARRGVAGWHGACRKTWFAVLVIWKNMLHAAGVLGY